MQLETHTNKKTETDLNQRVANESTVPTRFAETAPGEIKVIRRNGSITAFDNSKIMVALTKAFLAEEGGNAAASSRIHDTVATLNAQITATFQRRLPSGGTIHIEDIQDQVELALMRSGEQKVARSYVLYREERSKKRAQRQTKYQQTHELQITLENGQKAPFDINLIAHTIEEACSGLDFVNADLVIQDTQKNLFDGVTLKEINKAMIMCARTRVEEEPNYSLVTARLLLDTIRSEALTFLGLPAMHTCAEMNTLYASYFKKYIAKGVQLEILSPKLLEFNLDKISAALDGTRDLQFSYLGLQTLYDRYFINSNGTCYELPQGFFMRVAMGLAIEEDNREERAIEFYRLLSSFDFMSSTPTLFNSGTLHPQLSSCFLTSIPDDLDGIYSAIKDNALLAKYSGGLGNDWTPVRAMGARIKGTNGKSQGSIPFMKVANDTAVAVNQGGKRKGAVCGYLETWHLDIEEFLELRKNTGDERRRTHDMNTANWIPDLFMKRVCEETEWTLFSPDETPDLHDRYGLAFEKAYVEYEAKAERGEIRNFKKIGALNLWRKMLGMLFETGHPWMIFKDPCNLRSPQQHVGVVHSSNLCTEITLNTSKDEIAVCNLGSINLPNHMTANGLDLERLRKTAHTAIRMLDNVININFYTVPQAKNSNLKHRPIGLGLMGFQDALYMQKIPYSTQAAIEFADRSMEAISYYAIEASSDLAKERGKYESYEGSLWSKGIFPIDSIELLQEARGQYLDLDRSKTHDWDSLRAKVKRDGMRNSNVMAIAPTATIANITGVSQSIEPTYQNLYVKSNMSGEFTVLNPYLVRDLKNLNLWDSVMINDLKYFDGRLININRIPDDLKKLYATSFEIEPRWLIDAAARRQKWIDQSQSLNVYMAEPSGKKLDTLYKMAWLRGLKSTYYLRTLGATSTEKSTLHTGHLNAVTATATIISSDSAVKTNEPEECESCQ
jgi:ribonucleoside-diphosphate reductase alpha chain